MCVLFLTILENVVTKEGEYKIRRMLEGHFEAGRFMPSNPNEPGLERHCCTVNSTIRKQTHAHAYLFLRPLGRVSRKQGVHSSMVGHQAASTLLNKTGTAKTAHGRKLIAKGPGNAGRGSAWTGHMNAGESAGRDYVGPPVGSRDTCRQQQLA